MKNSYIEKYTTNDVEVDINEQLSTVDILKLLQRVTFSHSSLIGLDHKTMIKRDNAFWVITKMKYVCRHPISANQKLTLKTWTRQPQSVRFLRDLQIKDKNKILVSGISEWCCLDFLSRTLRRSNSIKYPDLEMVETKNNNLTFTNLKLDVDKNNYVYTKTIMASDIDVNLHTNNLKYTSIALDAFSLDELQNKVVKEYEIYFVNETKIGDKIDIYKKKVKNLYYVEGKKENQTVFRVVLKFSKN